MFCSLQSPSHTALSGKDADSGSSKRMWFDIYYLCDPWASPNLHGSQFLHL